MAATKKSKTKKTVDMTLSIGDCVRVVSATIFDNKGNLSDLLAVCMTPKTRLRVASKNCMAGRPI